MNGLITEPLSEETKKLKQGDVFTMDVTISGEGNLHNLEKPKLPLASGMVVYGDPTLAEEYIFGSKGAVGSITYSYNIQVTKPGIQQIPAVRISYFDPFLEKYISIVSDSSTTIDVKANPKFEITTNDELTTQNIDMTVDKCAPLMKFKPSRDSIIFNSKLFWAGIISPLAVAFLFLFFIKKREKESESKQTVAKINSIKQDSKSYLYEAKQNLHAGNTEIFYLNLEKGISKMCIAIAHLDESMIYSRLELMNGLKHQGVSDEKIQQIHSIFEECDNARYGIAGSSLEQSHLLETIESIKKELIG